MPRPTYTVSEAIKNFDDVLRLANKPGGVRITLRGQKPMVMLSSQEFETLREAVEKKLS